MLRVEQVTGDGWTMLRTLRLRALEVDADAFGATLEDEKTRSEAFWRQRIVTNAWFLAWAADHAVGLAAVVASPSLPSAERQLDAMWVVPAWRGRGIGEALIGTALDHVSWHGATSVSLTVLDGNRPARSLYQRMGFRPTGERSPRPRNPSQMHERFRLILRSEDHGQVQAN
ncbi:GNAT family N-acetyltransferase [Streptomyces sp. NPDC058142]|uniref:GNAT family N-acetyltransferase n=1 Tax=Streptomyces sp. NPDC058142 TaxID=3346355 RepID=UPI0036EB359F